MPDDTDIVDEPLDVAAPAPVVAAPPVAAPAAPGPMVLPPEFLAEAARRYAAARSGPMVAPPGYYSGGSFNPETGAATSFQGMAPAAAPPDALRDQMEQIRKSINATQFKQAQDAYKASVIFQATRAYQNDIKSGVAPEKALGRWGRLMFIDNPSALPGMTREARPIPEPSAVTVGGVPFVRHGRYGEQVTPLPNAGPVQGQQVYLPDGTPAPYFATQGARGLVLHPNKTSEPVLSPSAQASIYKQQIKEFQDQVDALPAETSERGKKPEVMQTRRELQSQLDETKRQRDELLTPRARQTTAAPSPYGKRQDQTDKGAGYFGELKRPDGRISTELSIGVEFDGKEREIPSLVPTLTRSEIDHLLAGGQPTSAIVDKAVAHARQRIKAGKSPFAQSGEQVSAPRGGTELNQADVNMLIDKANKAIAKGTDRAAVLKWLESKGVKLKE